MKKVLFLTIGLGVAFMLVANSGKIKKCIQEARNRDIAENPSAYMMDVMNQVQDGINEVDQKISGAKSEKAEWEAKRDRFMADLDKLQVTRNQFDAVLTHIGSVLREATPDQTVRLLKTQREYTYSAALELMTRKAGELVVLDEQIRDMELQVANANECIGLFDPIIAELEGKRAELDTLQRETERETITLQHEANIANIRARFSDENISEVSSRIEEIRNLVTERVQEVNNRSEVVQQEKTENIAVLFDELNGEVVSESTEPAPAEQTVEEILSHYLGN
ncbi:MAG: hypothetical protein NUW37_18665 [Planctomycetes bacterium]|nr:hypothetical protein [Planctomycetota bacterium]